MKKKREGILNPLSYYKFFKGKLESVSLFPERELRDIIYHLTGKNLGAFLSGVYSELEIEELYNETYKIVEKRKKRIPLDYIIGRSFFMDIELKVTPSVLIPRPDTETLVEEVLKHKRGDVVDIGTGSGNIGIVLAKHGFNVVATDINKEALEIAKYNVKLNKVKLRTKLCSFLECFDNNVKFDYVVSNPPYISEVEYKHLDIEVRQEPYSALVSPNGGLWHTFNILKGARIHLKRGGYVFIEISPLRAGKCAKIAQNLGYSSIQLIKDLSGTYRVLKARWV